jgi:hypothetical protein
MGKRPLGIMTYPRASKQDFLHMGWVTEPKQEKSFDYIVSIDAMPNLSLLHLLNLALNDSLRKAS